MNKLTPISPHGFIYNHIVSTGGIGSGIFFSIQGNETIGRNESRMATLLPYKDFCKQHIIMHYISVLLGTKAGGEFQSFPIGKVGNDETGRGLLSMMKDVGMDVTNVRMTNDVSTLFSVCFQYPDFSGGNITTNESASSFVSPADISNFFADFKLTGKEEIILAVPEVPVEARIKLLEYGRLRGSLNVASVLSSEVDKFKKLNGFSIVDILSVNLDEAKKITEIDNEVADTEIIVETCINKLKDLNQEITVLITCGSKGVYCYSKNVKEFTPAMNVPIVSTAGAGDAFLAGFLSGICCGLPFFKGVNDNYFSETSLTSAVEMGVLIASLSVKSPDTINTDANAESLYKFISQNSIKVGRNFSKIFSGCNQNNYFKIFN
jgi:sugar/nucleoside kinase (ribokinase family)